MPSSCVWLCARELSSKSPEGNPHPQALTEDVRDPVTLSDLVMCTSPDSCCFCWHSCTSVRKECTNERKSPWHVYFSNSIECQEDVALPLILKGTRWLVGDVYIFPWSHSGCKNYLFLAQYRHKSKVWK